ncbi:MAG: DMT family transporter [Lachnospiraceae bacterium]
MNKTKDKTIAGFLFAIVAGLLWGISGNCGDILFKQYGISVEFLVTWRLIITGLLMLSVLMVRKRPLFLIWCNKKDSALLAGFAILGMIGVQYFFFLTIRHSNAATATVIQYIAPIFIVIWTASRAKKLPHPFESIGVLLAFFGIYLFATGGSFQSLTVSGTALIFGFASALGLVFYMLLPIGIVSKYGTSIVVGWGMLLAGLVMLLLTRFPSSGIQWDLRALLLYLFLILFGTLIPFTLFIKSIQLIGAAKAGILSCMEPFSSVVVSVVWLGQRFAAADYLGFVCIILAVTLISVLDLVKENRHR